jgi:hypothetical protein
MTTDTRICIAEFDGWTHLRVVGNVIWGLKPNYAWTQAGCDGDEILPALTLDYLRDVRVRRFTPRQQIKFTKNLVAEVGGIYFIQCDSLVESLSQLTNATTGQVASAMEKAIKESK